MTLGTAQIAALRRKVAWRVLPLVFLLYIVAYLDRANVGFAKLRMAGDLKFSEEVFGLGIGIFFIGYLILEIPGALLVERWSARKWFARILISWGFISALTAFVHTPLQFYLARFFLGVAEAGFFPGIIVYFTHWFVSGDRARALSGLIMAVPLSLAIGAPVSAVLLDANWLGLAGWKWLFIIEGLPAVLLGVVTLLLMTDRPRDAKWLTPALFLVGSTIPGQPFAAVMAWLCLTGFAAFFWPSPFWALPTLTLTASAAAVAIGLINMGANLAGYLGNHATGWMKSHGAGDTAVLLFLASSYLLGAVIISFVKLNRPSVIAVNKSITLKHTATP